MFIGLENINPANLKGAQKHQNKITEYRQMLQAWRNEGILTYAGYILGFPADTPESIARDIEIIKRELPIDLLEFFILTPLPGSEDHQRLHRAGVPMDPDMNKYDLEHVTTDHPNMTRAQVQDVYFRAWDLYYTPEHIETLLRRAEASGATAKRAANMIVQFYGSVLFEKVHPLQSGLFRIKRRGSRRSGLSRESPFVFYPRRAWEILSTYIPGRPALVAGRAPPPPHRARPECPRVPRPRDDSRPRDAGVGAPRDVRGVGGGARRRRQGAGGPGTLARYVAIPKGWSAASVFDRALGRKLSGNALYLQSDTAQAFSGSAHTLGELPMKPGLTISLLAAALLVSGCGGGGGGGAIAASAPAPIFVTDSLDGHDHVWVTITKVVLHGAGTAVTVFEPAGGMTVDLRSLRDPIGARFGFLATAREGVFDDITFTLGKDVVLFETGSPNGLQTGVRRQRRHERQHGAGVLAAQAPRTEQLVGRRLRPRQLG